MMRSANPALNAATFKGFDRAALGVGDEVMTIQGTVNKTGFLLILTVLAASWVWDQFFASGGNPAAVMPWVMGGAIGGFVVGMGLAKPMAPPLRRRIEVVVKRPRSDAEGW